MGDTEHGTWTSRELGVHIAKKGPMRNCGCQGNEQCSKCDIYMKDPRAKTIEGFTAALEIFAKYAKNGKLEHYFLGAEHDVIYCWFNVSRDSEDGRLLRMLGWHYEDDESWGYWT